MGGKIWRWGEKYRFCGNQKEKFILELSGGREADKKI